MHIIYLYIWLFLNFIAGDLYRKAKILRKFWLCIKRLHVKIMIIMKGPKQGWSSKCLTTRITSVRIVTTNNRYVCTGAGWLDISPTCVLHSLSCYMEMTSELCLCTLEMDINITWDWDHYTNQLKYTKVC